MANKNHRKQNNNALNHTVPDILLYKWRQYFIYATSTPARPNINSDAAAIPTAAYSTGNFFPKFSKKIPVRHKVV